MDFNSHISASRIFEGNDLVYSYFPGGYFDVAGKVLLLISHRIRN